MYVKLGQFIHHIKLKSRHIFLLIEVNYLLAHGFWICSNFEFNAAIDFLLNAIALVKSCRWTRLLTDDNHSRPSRTLAQAHAFGRTAG